MKLFCWEPCSLPKAGHIGERSDSLLTLQRNGFQLASPAGEGATLNTSPVPCHRECTAGHADCLLFFWLISSWCWNSFGFQLPHLIDFNLEAKGKYNRILIYRNFKYHWTASLLLCAWSCSFFGEQDFYFFVGAGCSWEPKPRELPSVVLVHR